MSGLGGSRLGPASTVEPQASLEEGADENAGEPSDDETILAAATPEEMAEGAETGEAEPMAAEGTSSKDMRIEIQTKDPDVRIIWFTPAASEPAAVEN